MISCGRTEKRSFEAFFDSAKVQNAGPKVAGFVDTISYDLLCRPIDTVKKIFTSVHDSIFESEGVEWPGKVVTHTDGMRTVFESSWTDKKSIWRVTTTSKTINFQSPYQVGDEVGKIQNNGYSFTFNEGDGGQYYYFTDERLKYLGFRVEDRYSTEFYKNVHEKGLINPMKHLNSKARIIELTISGSCTEKEIRK